jgi:cyclic beta-1,2-glucan synthetase
MELTSYRARPTGWQRGLTLESFVATQTDAEAPSAPPLSAEEKTGAAADPLREHARRLALRHRLAEGRPRDLLQSRTEENSQVLLSTYLRLNRQMKGEPHVPPAVAWLLDNFYLVQEQVHMARSHLPRKYSLELPQLEGSRDSTTPGGDADGLPRVFDLARELISRVDGRLNAACIEQFISGYQSVATLRIGELWAIPIMLRLALIENLRRVGERIEKLSRKSPAASSETNREHGEEDLLSMGNSITSLRALSAIDWSEIIENQSALDRILREDPAGVFPRMSFSSRDQYRHVVEELARQTSLAEDEVARKALALALAAEAIPRSESVELAGQGRRHVGYYLFAPGLALLEKEIGYRRQGWNAVIAVAAKMPLVCYLGAIAAIWGLAVWIVAGVAWQLGAAQLSPALAIVLALLFAGAAGQFATTLVNWLCTLIVRPRTMLRMDFTESIPAEYRTLVAVPTLLASPASVSAMVDQMEVRYLANKDDNLQFALVTDFLDADEASKPGDADLLAQVRQGIESLNQRHAPDGPSKFYLLHRPRKWEPQEGVWMGEERKRGKLAALNQLLRTGQQGEFSEVVGNLADLASIRFVITLDADTRLPRDAARQLVACMAHPLNRAELDPITRVVRSGYGVLQPRATIMLPDANRSIYSRLMAGDAGIDPYTRQTSNVYQDVFGEGSFIGKGIYDVEAFDAALEGRMPDHRVLSHDLIEGCFVRSGLINDVELFEGYPSRLLADMSRRHRWIRGDWQIAAWLLPWVPGHQGRRRNPLSWLSAWKIFDNLARSLVPVFLLAFLVIGWTLSPALAAWCTFAAVATLFGPTLICGLPGFFRKPEEKPWVLQIRDHAETCARNLSGELIGLAILPYTVHCHVDAILRTLYRLAVSRQKLLEWTTASEAEICCEKDLRGHYRLMWACTAVAFGLPALLAIANPWALLFAAPVLLGWLAGPWIAWQISRPQSMGAAASSPAAAADFGRWARQTWHYFETHLGPRDHWLPPDNVQEHPEQMIASRTSPTNVGMSLLSDLAACDLGYLPAYKFLKRTGRTLDTMERLERYRGHWLNWYDTQTLSPIEPRYVSTVDSGNLLASLSVLQAGLEELVDRPIVAERLAQGIDDTLRAIAAVRYVRLSSLTTPETPSGPLDDSLSRLEGLCAGRPQMTATQTLLWLAELRAHTTLLALVGAEGPEVSRWLTNLHRQIVSTEGELLRLTFWKATAAPIQAMLQGGQLDRRIRIEPLAELMAAVDARNLHCTFRELPAFARETAARAQAILAHMAGLNGRHDPTKDALRSLLAGLAEDALAAAKYADELIAQFASLARRCKDLGAMDFEFLFDEERELFAIGMNVSEGRRDNSFYDLLASESRLTSFLTVSRGQLPQSHWFALGRMVTIADGEAALLSWSGSMFEYLMPMLFMPTYPRTLLEVSCAAAVRQQIRYASQQGMPWGISESCYNVVDNGGVYQYRAFGVPALGLSRGLSGHRVIAPYATALAAMVMPEEAWANLRHMERLGYLGPYGFYDAVDYTPQRRQEGGQPAVCRCVMSHHSGMTLLSLANVLLGRPMERRFFREASCRAHDLLLQERAPQAVRPIDPRAGEPAAEPPALAGEIAMTA